MPEEFVRSHPRPPRQELRRSVRVSLDMLIGAAWQARPNEPIHEEALVLDANVFGAALRMRTRPAMGTVLELTNRIANETARARVVAIRPGILEAVAVEFLVPSETFWGIAFRLKKAALDLRALEDDIKSGGADPRVLQDFRDAVDYVRKTAWAVNEWQERQLKHKDSATVFSLLATERVRRATQLNDAVVAEMNARQLNADSPGIPEFIRAVEQTYQRLRELKIDQEEK